MVKYCAAAALLRLSDMTRWIRRSDDDVELWKR